MIKKVAVEEETEKTEQRGVADDKKNRDNGRKLRKNKKIGRNTQRMTNNMETG